MVVTTKWNNIKNLWFLQLLNFSPKQSEYVAELYLNTYTVLKETLRDTATQLTEETQERHSHTFNKMYNYSVNSRSDT